MGCDLAQGFYLSRSLPAPGFESLLEAGLPLAEPEAAGANLRFGGS